MSRYVLKRVLMLVIIILSITFIVFALMSLAPGDPGTIILGGSASEEEVAAYNHSVGYDRPFLVKYFDFLYNMCFKLDFGISYRTRQPIMNEIVLRLPVSFKMAFLGVVFSALVGIPLGVLSAVKQYSLLDTIPTFIALLLQATPAFLMGMVLIYVFAYRLRWLPAYGLDSIEAYILPIVAIGAMYAGRILRFTRSSMLETIRADYVRTARAKGAAERTVIWKHALKNGLLPVITMVGGSLGAQIGGAVVTENLFNIPGLATLILTSIRVRDTPTVVATAVVLGAIYNVILLMVDILFAFVDPRIKAKYSK